jgi:hypothetical protein
MQSADRLPRAPMSPQQLRPIRPRCRILKPFRNETGASKVLLSRLVGESGAGRFMGLTKFWT